MENLDVLKEENGVLKEHLLKLKEEVTDKGQEEERINNALRKAEEDFMLLEKQKNDA